jgi:hypothetical protein
MPSYNPGARRRAAFRWCIRLLGRALVERRDAAVELDCQTLRRAGRSADVDRRTCLPSRDDALAILEEGLVARVWPKDLIALRGATRLGVRDRTRTDYLPLRHRLVEPQERRKDWLSALHRFSYPSGRPALLARGPHLRPRTMH